MTQPLWDRKLFRNEELWQSWIEQQRNAGTLEKAKRDMDLVKQMHDRFYMANLCNIRYEYTKHLCRNITDDKYVADQLQKLKALRDKELEEAIQDNIETLRKYGEL